MHLGYIEELRFHWEHDVKWAGGDVGRYHSEREKVLRTPLNCYNATHDGYKNTKKK